MDYHSAGNYILTQLFLQITQVVPKQNDTILLIVALLLLIVLAFVSGSEIAFFSLDDKDLNMLRARQNANTRLIVQLLDEPKLLLATIRITNILLKLAIILSVNFLIDQLFIAAQPGFWLFLTKLVVISFVLILFGESLPKVYAAQYSIRMALATAFLLSVLHKIFLPLSQLLISSTSVIEQKMSRKNNSSVSKAEIDHAIELTVDESASQEEKNILKGIVKFGNITVKQIARSRLDVSGIDYNISFTELVKLVADLSYSRLPVYKDDLDTIMGIIHSKDLLPHLDEPADFDWHQLIRTAYFVHEHKMIEDLLHEFQAMRMHFAIVVDEFGGTSGIVTLEDIMEEIIGDIKDEFDEEEYFYQKIDDHNYIFEGKTMLNDVCRIIDISDDSFEKVQGESDSLGGLILELAGEFPEPGSVINYNEFDFTVQEINKMRINRVKVTIKPEIKIDNG